MARRKEQQALIKAREEHKAAQRKAIYDQKRKVWLHSPAAPHTERAKGPSG